MKTAELEASLVERGVKTLQKLGDFRFFIWIQNLSFIGRMTSGIPTAVTSTLNMVSLKLSLRLLGCLLLLHRSRQ